jgi:uncharacterized OB-fold protein
MPEERPARPAPKPDVFVPTGPFWEGARQGRLVLQFCKDTGRFQHYPRPVSLYTGSRNLEWREVSGRGTVYAATTIRVPGPGLDGRLPLAVVTVELEEGVRILGNIVESEGKEIAIGARVELAWDRLGDGTPYPAFRIA